MGRNRARSRASAQPLAKPIDLQITPEQTKLLMGLHNEIQAAQDRLNLASAGVVAGHGYGVVQVVSIDPEKNILSILEPPK